MFLQNLIEQIEKSAKKSGHDTPLTVGELLSFIKLAQMEENNEKAIQEYDKEQWRNAPQH